MLRNTFAYLALLVAGINAQSNDTSNSGGCSSELTTNHSAPVVADGYTARLVATNLTSPRGLKFDTEDNLLVVEQEVGISVLRFEDDGGDCLRMTSKETLVSVDTLNHGIEISSDGNTLYASDSDKLYAWDYSASERRTTSEPRTLIQNMEGTNVVEFADGEPVEPSNSLTAAKTIVSNEDNSVCPDACFRPVGLAWDSSGRLFMSSDETGEIYVITRDEGATGTTNNVTRPAGTGSPSSSPSSFNGAAVAVRGFDGMGALAVVLCALAFLL